MKPGIAFIVAFLAAATVTTGMKVVKTKPPVPSPARDSATADSTTRTDTAVVTAKDSAAKAAAVDSAKPPIVASAAAESTEKAAASSARKASGKSPASASSTAKPPVTATPAVTPPKITPAAATKSAPKSATKSTAAATPGGSTAKSAASKSLSTQTSSVGDTASERRLSKVFTAMEPKQAAKVLEHMTNSDIHIILGYVGPRQAASIMAELPPERVAVLSKLAMQGQAK